MRAEPTACASSQRGFALVAALFLVVIAAGIGAVLMRSLQSGAGRVDLGVLAQRAHFASAAGLQWARYRIDATGGCVAGTLSLRERALSGFSVTVSCAATTQGSGPTQRRVYQLQSLARYGAYGTPGYASRQTIENYTP